MHQSLAVFGFIDASFVNRLDMELKKLWSIKIVENFNFLIAESTANSCCYNWKSRKKDKIEHYDWFIDWFIS